jgi:hypothetical protein
MVQILQDDNMHKYFKYYDTVAQTSTVTAFLRCSDGNDVHVHSMKVLEKWQWKSKMLRCISSLQNTLCRVRVAHLFTTCFTSTALLYMAPTET